MIFRKSNPEQPFDLCNLEDHNFLHENRAIYDLYVEIRARGFDPVMAFHKTFGRDLQVHPMDLHLVTDKLEDVTNEQFQKRLNEISISEMWSKKHVVQMLAELANDKFVSPKVRLGAMCGLNSITGIKSSKEHLNEPQ